MSDSDIRLHIGGKEPKPGWLILNAQPGPHVDVVGVVQDLSGFADESVAEVYASHVLEHLGYHEELPRALAGIHRVLKVGGTFHISVPDLETLCWMFLNDKVTPEGRFFLMRMMFGGQVDAFDYHKVGLTLEILSGFLRKAGFTEFERVEEHGLFDDTSSMQVGGKYISLNIRAVKR
jgi:predicted SAM-dependent methyltransferase